MLVLWGQSGGEEEESPSGRSVTCGLIAVSRLRESSDLTPSGVSVRGTPPRPNPTSKQRELTSALLVPKSIDFPNPASSLLNLVFQSSLFSSLKEKGASDPLSVSESCQWLLRVTDQVEGIWSEFVERSVFIHHSSSPLSMMDDDAQVRSRTDEVPARWNMISPG